MPSSTTMLRVLGALTFALAVASAGVSGAKTKWPGYVAGWGNSCGSQFRGCTGQASDVYDACVKQHGHGCSGDYDRDYAGCQQTNKACQVRK